MAFLNFKVFSLKGRGKGDLSDVTPSEVELLSQYFESDSISTIPTLEEVTTAGNTTSKEMVVQGVTDELSMYNNAVVLTSDLGEPLVVAFVPQDNPTVWTFPNDESLDPVNFKLFASREWVAEQVIYKTVTYDELVYLMNNNSLIKNKVYLLIDYMTTYIEPTIGLTKSSDIVEPLYITATDVNKLHSVCRSQLYPQDIVYYDIRNMHGASKGFIYRRIDTLYNNDIGTDWRHIKYRRWAINVTNLLTVGTSYVLGDVVTTLSGFILVCAKNHTYAGGMGDLSWSELWFKNGDFVSPSNTGIRLRSSDIGPITIPVDSALFQDLPMFEIGDGNINNYIACRDIEELFYNTVILGQFKNNRITVNYFNNNTFWNFNTNNIHASLDTNIIVDFNGNTVSSVVQGFSGNILKEVTENTFNGSFRNNISTGRLSRSDVQDFYGNTFGDLDWTLIKNFCSSNTFIRIVASEIGTEFVGNFINRQLVGCTLSNYVRNLNIQTDAGALVNWTMEQLAGTEFNSDSLPLFPENIYPRLYRRMGEFAYTYHYTYIDDFGDTIIEDLL